MQTNKRSNMEVDANMDIMTSSSGDNNMDETNNNLPRKVDPPPRYKPLPISEYEDWTYMKRREMQEIIPDLYLGPYGAASKSQLENLQRVGITHIVCIRHMIERSVIKPVHGDKFTYLIIEMADDATEQLIPYCHKVNKFLDNCFASGGKALVHSTSGMSRSAAMVIAYIMSTYGVTAKQALKYVQAKRLSANPNEWFMYQLKEYEPIYQAQHDYPLALPTEREWTRPTYKRNFELVEDEVSDDFIKSLSME